MTDFVNRIESLRKAKGWHRTVIAAEFNVGERTVMRWEAGTTSVPSDYIPRLAEMFDVSPAQLMGWDRSDSPAPQKASAA